VGYCPTGSSEVREVNPLPGGTNPNTKHLRKTMTYKPNAMKPTQQNNPTLKSETCLLVAKYGHLPGFLHTY